MIYNVSDYMIKPNADGERVNPTKNNYQYSETDHEWLSKFYPVDSDDKPTINVVFNDGEDWKKYWVKKVVKEKLAPCVGINFVFDLPVKTESNEEFKCEVIVPTNGSPTNTNGLPLGLKWLFGILGTALGVMFLWGLFHLLLSAYISYYK